MRRCALVLAASLLGCSSDAEEPPDLLARILCEQPIKSFGLGTLMLIDSLCDPGLVYAAQLGTGTLTFAYDARPNLVGMSATGVLLSPFTQEQLEFDVDNWLVKRTRSDRVADEETTFAREASGRLAASEITIDGQPHESATYGYGGSGLLEAKTVAVEGEEAQEIVYVYNGLSQLELRERREDSKVTEQVALAYDGDVLRSWERTRGSPRVAMRFTYDLRDRLIERDELSDGHVRARSLFAYGEDGRLHVETRTGTSPEELTYTYSNEGLLVRVDIVGP